MKIFLTYELTLFCRVTGPSRLACTHRHTVALLHQFLTYSDDHPSRQSGLCPSGERLQLKRGGHMQTYWSFPAVLTWLRGYGRQRVKIEKYKGSITRQAEFGSCYLALVRIFVIITQDTRRPTFQDTSNRTARPILSVEQRADVQEHQRTCWILQKKFGQQTRDCHAPRLTTGLFKYYVSFGLS